MLNQINGYATTTFTAWKSNVKVHWGVQWLKRKFIQSIIEFEPQCEEENNNNNNKKFTQNVQSFFEKIYNNENSFSQNDFFLIILQDQNRNIVVSI